MDDLLDLYMYIIRKEKRFYRKKETSPLDLRKILERKLPIFLRFNYYANVHKILINPITFKQ